MGLSAFLNNVRENIHENSRINIGEQLEEIKVESTKKENHRYQQQSGNLSKAVEDIIDDDFNGQVVLNGSISGAGKYAVPIHEGFKKNGKTVWAKDQFLTNAGIKLENQIQDSFDKVVEDSIREAI